MNTIFPLGHFYSPMINNEEVKKDESRIWPRTPEIHGIDFNSKSHLDILNSVVPQYIGQMNYPHEPNERKNDYDFYLNNSQFPYIDGIMLFILLQHFKPKKVIEIGSGFSSFVTADVSRRFFNSSIEFVCIEPYPSSVLQKGVPGITVLIPDRVQDVTPIIYERLEPGDILFIDSSHVAKTGSDVVFLYFQILPLLQSGVNIHIHDIFLPSDYPKNWVIDEGRGWNEQYLLQALLMYSNAFSVVFGSQYAACTFPELIKSQFGTFYGGGSSLWIKKE